MLAKIIDKSNTYYYENCYNNWYDITYLCKSYASLQELTTTGKNNYVKVHCQKCRLRHNKHISITLSILKCIYIDSVKKKNKKTNKNKTKQSKAKQNKVKQRKTGQNKTKQNRTERNKIGE